MLTYSINFIKTSLLTRYCHIYLLSQLTFPGIFEFFLYIYKPCLISSEHVKNKNYLIRCSGSGVTRVHTFHFYLYYSVSIMFLYKKNITASYFSITWVPLQIPAGNFSEMFRKDKRIKVYLKFNFWMRKIIGFINNFKFTY